MLIELQRRASLANGADTANLLAHPEVVDLPLAQIEDGRVIVAERAGGPVGFSVILPNAGGEWELDGLFVEPGSWRGGVGRQLLRAAEDLAREEGATTVRVVANLAARPFYEACGFTPAGTAQTEFGPAPAMRKKLRA